MSVNLSFATVTRLDATLAIFQLREASAEFPAFRKLSDTPSEGCYGPFLRRTAARQAHPLPFGFAPGR